jgi:hypothetical protein
MMKRKTLVLKSGAKIRISGRVLDKILDAMNRFTQEGMIIVRKTDDYSSPVIFTVKYGDISAIH